MEIIHAVIPAAGHGTRFLPFTKAVPKEMLPLLNKPAIHFIVDEIAQSGMKNCIMITARHKQAIADYFNPAPTLELFLKNNNKSQLLDEVNRLSAQVSFDYIYQDYAKGLGHAVGLARDVVGDQFFAILLPDDIMMHEIAGIMQLKLLAIKHQATIIAVQEMPTTVISAYGVVGIKKQISDDLFEINSVVEKPSPADAPSNLAIIGRYIFCPEIFKMLDTVLPAKNGEFQLTDGISQLIQHSHPVLAYKIKGTRYDVGTPSGWFAANNKLFESYK